MDVGKGKWGVDPEDEITFGQVGMCSFRFALLPPETNMVEPIGSFQRQEKS